MPGRDWQGKWVTWPDTFLKHSVGNVPRTVLRLSFAVDRPREGDRPHAPLIRARTARVDRRREGHLDGPLGRVTPIRCPGNHHRIDVAEQPIPATDDHGRPWVTG